MPAADWKFAACDTAANPFPGTPNPASVCLRGGFDPQYLYELVYVAKDPKVMGVEPVHVPLAAVRVWPSRVVPLMDGATVLPGLLPATVVVAAEAWVALPVVLVAVTDARIVLPMSAETSV